MQRREFLYATSLICLSANATDSLVESKVLDVIDSVLAHMFDSTDIVPRYDGISVLKFIQETLYHPSYDKEIRDFVLQGAKVLLDMHPNFTKSTHFQKEIYLREFEDIPMGQSWLYRVQILGFEAIYSSPVYGVNSNQKYYHYIKTQAGKPLPKVRYIDL